MLTGRGMLQYKGRCALLALQSALGDKTLITDKHLNAAVLMQATQHNVEPVFFDGGYWPPSALACALRANTDFRLKSMPVPPPASVFGLDFPSEDRFLLDVSILRKGTIPRWHMIAVDWKTKKYFDSFKPLHLHSFDDATLRRVSFCKGAIRTMHVLT